MPTIREYKVALKAACFSYLAGAHSVTEAVWINKSDRLTGEKKKDALKKLTKFYKDFCKNPHNAEHLTDLMNEEGLYPFGDAWSSENITKLIGFLKPLVVSDDDAVPGTRSYRFKKGFHKALTDAARARFSVADEDADISQSGLDHWLSLILNTAFHAGAVAASRSAKVEASTFYSALSALEQESDPWSKYDQINRLYDNEMSREEENYDEDDDDEGGGFGYDDDDEGDDEDDLMRSGYGYDDDDEGGDY